MDTLETDDGTLLKSTALFAEVYEPEASKKAEAFLLDYTASGCWEDMEGLDWTTSELHEVLTKFIKANAKADSQPPNQRL